MLAVLPIVLIGELPKITSTLCDPSGTLNVILPL